MVLKRGRAFPREAGMSLVNRLDRDSTYDQRLRHVLTERSSTSSSRRGMKRAPGSRNGISVRARSGRSGGERIFYTKRNKPWKVLCTFSYKVKMISSLSLRAVWKLFFSFSLAVSSGPFNCGGVRQLLYKLYSTNFKIVQF